MSGAVKAMTPQQAPSTLSASETLKRKFISEIEKLF